VYVLAGNCLQGTNWHENPEVAKNIILFYSKAKAFQKLADFYDTCAQLEIDEYKDYEKAQAAIKESIKYVHKLNDEQKL
jgi:intraflagellar transport protein 140